jgi:hypothetical protein
MDYSAFLKIDNVPGDSKDSKHPGWIALLGGFTFGRTYKGDDGKDVKEGSDIRQGDSTQLEFTMSKQGSAAYKLYLAYTGQLKITGTVILADVSQEHGPDHDSYSERVYEMKDVKVVNYQDVLPTQEWTCDASGKKCGNVQPPAVAAWVTLEFPADNPTPPPRASQERSRRGYGYGYGGRYGRYGGYRGYRGY